MLVKFFIGRLLHLLLFLLPVTASLASTESYIQTLSGKIRKGDSCTVIDDKFQNMPIAVWNQLRNLSVDNIITFEIRQDTSILYQYKTFSCKLNISIKYFTSRGQEKPGETDNIDLVVKYDTAKGATFPMQKDYRFKNAYKVIVVVNSIESAEWGKELPAIFRLRNQLFIERKYPFQTQVKGVLSAYGGQPEEKGRTTRVEPGPYDPATGLVTISWYSGDFNDGHGASAYDVEWTFLDRMSDRGNEIASLPPGTGVTDNQVATWMRDDNTRVTVSGTEYKIHLPYADGYILMRVRGVDYTTDEPPLRLTTDWLYGNGTNHPAIYPVSVTESHQPLLNWQYNASYAEEGKRKELVSYLDGSLRSRQTVTINNTDVGGQIAVVAETVYDNMGRSAMNILPAPLDAHKLDYYAGVNKNTTGQPYSHTDLTSATSGNTTCTIGAGLLSPSSGASLYYSSSNPFLGSSNNYDRDYYFTKYVPDAQRYPFSTTQYTPDNTGRIRRQGGVGQTFQIGGGHDTRYYYAKPLQKELDRLFGSEAGSASHYQKNMVVDANGQASVSYIDANGKTIATALAGINPATLSPLPSANASLARTRMNEIIVQTADFSVDAGSLTKHASSTFLAAITGPFQLHYSVSPAAFVTTLSDNTKFCSNCFYSVVIDVKNECGMSAIQGTAPFTSQPFRGETMNCTAEPTTPLTGNINLYIPSIGEYTVTYRLQLSNEVLDQQVNDWVIKNTDLKTIQQFFHEEFEKIDLSSCYSDCSTCAIKLGNKADFADKMRRLLLKIAAEKYQADLRFNPESTEITGMIDAKWDELNLACRNSQENCGAATPCEQKLQLLKLDVLPRLAEGTNPQGYALYSVDAGHTYSIYAPERSISVLTHWREPVYDIPFNDDNGTPLTTNSLSESAFIQAYLEHPEWADIFVKLHKEYCSYQWCKDQVSTGVIPNRPSVNYNEKSYIFDETLRQIDVGSDAVAKHYYFDRSTFPVDPYVLLNQDPFFTVDGRGLPYYQAMHDDLDRLSDILHYSGPGSTGGLVTKGIVDFVDWALYCKPTRMTNPVPNAQWNPCPPPGDECRSETGEWILFRDYYLQLKSRYMAIVKATNWSSCTNCYIGSDGLYGTGTSATCPPAATSVSIPCKETSTICRGSEAYPCDECPVWYGQYGTRIFAPGYATNGTGAQEPMPPNGPYTWGWGYNAMNETSVWTCGDVGRDYSRVQFSRQIYFPPNSTSTGPPDNLCTYYFGMGGDNYMQVRIDNNLILDLSDFQYWSVYPVTLSPGYHTITISGRNDQGPCAVGLEIYNNTLNDLNRYTTRPELNVLYSTLSELQHYCSVDLPPSYCASDESNTLYRNKTRIFNEYVNTDAYAGCFTTSSGSTTDDGLAGVRTRMKAEVDATLSLSWLTALQAARDGEPAFNDIPDSKIQAIVAAMALVAKEYIEHAPNDNIRAASTLPSPLSVTIGGSAFTSFRDAFVRYIDASYILKGFNENLLENPYPYNKTPFSVNPNILTLDPEVIRNFRAFVVRSGFVFDPVNIAAIRDFAKTALEDDYTFKDDAAFNDFFIRCYQACSLLNSPLLLPVAFATAVPSSTGNADHPSTDCSRISALKADFDGTYQGIAVGSQLYRISLTNFINHQLGYALSYSEYADFAASCTSVSVLYNKPGSPYIPIDEMACVAGILRPAFDRAGQEYEYYIRQKRIEFRNALVSKCLSNGAAATVEGDQYEYHYTLYYYDQAGNLVKTIPPEGVKLLTDKEIEQMRDFRGTDPAKTCNNCTGLQTLTDKKAIFQLLSGWLQTNAVQSLELWLKTTDGTATRQARFVTPDNRYLVQTAVYNGAVWAEIYTLSWNGSYYVVTNANRACKSMAGLPALQSWTHLQIQTSGTGGLGTGTLQMYLDGQLLRNPATGSVPIPFGWGVGTNLYTLPAGSVGQIKQIRMYNRPASGSEIEAEYRNGCLGPVGNLANQGNPLLLWGRLNVPAYGTPGTNTPNPPSWDAGSVYISSGTPANYSNNLLSTVSNTFTMEFWVKPTQSINVDMQQNSGVSGTSGQKYAIFPSYGGVGSDYSRAGMGVSVGTNGIGVYEHSGGYMPALLFWRHSLSRLFWTHVAVVYTNKRPRLFVNGQPVWDGEQSTKANVCPSYNLDGGPYGNMRGSIDQLLIWNEARTGDEITHDMMSPPPAGAPNLAGNWPISPRFDQQVLDVSGNGNNILLSGTYNWSPQPGIPLFTQYCVEEYIDADSRFIVPSHNLPTYYTYNSQNQVVNQTTPDGGTTQFWYDRLGRMVASQNAEQKDPASPGEPGDRYSYTRYDPLGRIIEVGEKTKAPSLDETISRDDNQLAAWNTSGTQNRQVTVTAYDNSPSWIPATVRYLQTNLRKRVAATALISTNDRPDLPIDPSQYRTAASYYCYDVAGNVNHLVQENADQWEVEKDKFGNNTTTDFLKHIRYEYDLISGKVNKVKYQEGKWDQFFHRYEYDAENRLLSSYSSRLNDPLGSSAWILDAQYRYYLHGPLARMELGKYKVQGVDYAYTLQGWLKGVNGSSIPEDGAGAKQNAGTDMSDDGLPGGFFPQTGRDVFAYSLGYYGNDYTPIGSGSTAFGLRYTLPATGTGETGQPLFNGNISWATYALGKIDNNNTAGYTYSYDQLNRLTAMNRHRITDFKGWDNGNQIRAYSERIQYDANGNISRYLRNGSSDVVSGTGEANMDELTYRYNVDPDGRLVNNRLRHVNDKVPDGDYPHDIDDQGDDNYRYDNIGNLIQNSKEELENINWTVYGKIAGIDKGGNTIRYSYDPAGNRIVKTVKDITTFYVRDAQGNVMGVYEMNNSRDAYSWKEQDLYGNSRLGTITPEIVLEGNGNDDTYPKSSDPMRHEGNRVYELSNHLGNVMVTVSDIKHYYPANVYLADIVSAQDYYPFGMKMPDRVYGSQGRYGFNGQEHSIETGDDSYTAEFWEYDARTGRRWNVDPVKRPSVSSYSSFGGNPITNADPLGDTWFDKVRAKFWSWTHGGEGRVDKSSDGKNWVAYGAQPDGGGISIKKFKDHHLKLKFEFKGESSIGVQFGYNFNKTPFVDRIPFLKDVKAKVDVNIFSSTIFQGSTSSTYDATANSISSKSSFSAPAFDGDPSGIGVLWKHGLGLELGKGNNLIGYKYEYSYRQYNGYYGPRTIEGSEMVEHKGYIGTRSIPFFGDESQNFKNGGLFPNSPYNVNPRVKTTLELSTKGVSLQTNLNFNFILRVDGAVKLGIEYD